MNIQTDPFFVLESQHGYKVAWCPQGKPMGGNDNGNYSVIADGLKRQEAVDMAKRLRK